MSANFIAKASVNIAAPASRVWDALTNPDLIKQYFFGTQAVSDWKEGSTLEFKGVWDGKTYLDKGVILKSQPEKLFQYTYYSSFSNLPDAPENYSNISYELDEENGETALTIKQENVANEEARKHSEQNWNHVLKSLKDLLEK
ncbi:SRPBCC family protein [Chryseolinea sp. H1M3-3]|uniref:SRPBCC family protein n=1 Tax=Chryseolinea sp. H1M3-3 TaxID=3034144 RepID=UPI0023EDF2D7|nr:SRPBCC family protein [Chryseolinea sp. H1M3-3]